MPVIIPPSVMLSCELANSCKGLHRYIQSHEDESQLQLDHDHFVRYGEMRYRPVPYETMVEEPVQALTFTQQRQPRTVFASAPTPPSADSTERQVLATPNWELLLSLRARFGKETGRRTNWDLIYERFTKHVDHHEKRGQQGRYSRWWPKCRVRSECMTTLDGSCSEIQHINSTCCATFDTLEMPEPCYRRCPLPSSPYSV